LQQLPLQTFVAEFFGRNWQGEKLVHWQAWNDPKITPRHLHRLTKRSPIMEMGHASLIKAPTILNDALCHLRSPSQNERANAIATVKESVAAIEAFTNELTQVGVGYEKCGHTASNPIVLMSQKLRASERASIKDKIKIACEALSGKKCSKGQPLFQKFSLTIDVRDELTHPKASVISIGFDALSLPEAEQKLIRRLKSYGFNCDETQAHDWTSAVTTKAFAEWAHLSIVQMMFGVIYLWPYPDAIPSYLKLYGLDKYIEPQKGE
jgi:hypothetical protein